jgi:hypothetical protein
MALRNFTLPLTLAAVLSVLPAVSLRADPPPAENAPGSAAAPAAAEPQAAVWAPRQLRFTYLGFTSKYSCDGLQDKMRRILLALGARKEDLTVDATGCAGGFSRPSPFPGVSIKMHVLVPATGVAGTAAPPFVPALWKTVDLTQHRDVIDAAGDCELIEQVKAHILPKFTTRSVEYRSTCIPYQLTVGGTQLKAEVLIASEQPAKPPVAAQ